MELAFTYTRITRERVNESIKGLPFDKLLAIPEGFKNNILWNYGHIAVTQHLLCFKLANRKPILPSTLIDAYRKGSMAIDIASPQEDYEYFNANFFKLIDFTQEQYASNQLKDFSAYTTSYGVSLGSIEEAIAFNNMHEALHLGYIMAMKKSLV